MSLDRKYQIFISSTFLDLQEERRILMESILRMNHIPVGMELFNAANESQWQYIKRRIKQCDYYVVVVAERYGSVSEQGLGFTEMEYDFALSKGVPVVGFLLSDRGRGQWPASLVELNNRDKLAAFRAKCTTRLVSFWDNSGDLAAKCILTLNELFDQYERPGWVSGNSVASPEVLNEFARLTAENKALHRQLAGLEAKLALFDTTAEFERISQILEPLSAVSLARAIPNYLMNDDSREAFLDFMTKCNGISALKFIQLNDDNFVGGCYIDDTVREVLFNLGYISEEPKALEDRITDQGNQREILYRTFEPLLFHLAKLKILEVTHPPGVEEAKQRSALRVWRYTTFGRDFSTWSTRRLSAQQTSQSGEEYA